MQKAMAVESIPCLSPMPAFGVRAALKIELPAEAFDRPRQPRNTGTENKVSAYRPQQCGFAKCASCGMAAQLSLLGCRICPDHSFCLQYPFLCRPSSCMFLHLA